MIVPAIVVSVLCAIPVLWFLTPKSKVNTLLVDLGLKGKLTGTKPTPFYKWKWRHNSSEGVWAERIVRDAFKKARIGISTNDLTMFRDLCDSGSLGKPINKEEVIQEIKKIVLREELLEKTLIEMVKKMVLQLVTTRENDANFHLEKLGIPLSGREAVLTRFGIQLILDNLEQAGHDILALKSKGFSLRDKNNRLLYRVVGIDGWRKWIQTYKKSLWKLLTYKKYSGYNSILKSIDFHVSTGLLQVYEEDIQKHYRFLDYVTHEFPKQPAPITKERILDFEKLLFTWQFSKGVPFTVVDHNRLREMLLRDNLSDHFRAFVITHISSDFESLLRIMEHFPRNVIFLGANQQAREYAADQYYTHIKSLLGVLVPLTGQDSKAPAPIVITEDEIEQCQEKIVVKAKVSAPRSAKQGVDPADVDVEIHDLIQKKMLNSCDERNLDESNAYEYGWLIVFPLSSSGGVGSQLLETGTYKVYVQISCDCPDSVDLTSFSLEDRYKQNTFLTKIFKQLIRAKM